MSILVSKRIWRVSDRCRWGQTCVGSKSCDYSSESTTSVRPNIQSDITSCALKSDVHTRFARREVGYQLSYELCDIQLLREWMGDTGSNPANNSQAEEEPYILDKPESLSLNCYIHYWIDPNIFTIENQKYEHYLREKLNVEGVSSLEGFKAERNSTDSLLRVKVISAASLKDKDYEWLQNNEEVEEVTLFCLNRERANLLMTNFPKIKSARFDIKSLRMSLLESQQQASFNNLLFLVEDDTQILNRHRINFYAMVFPHERAKGKADYLIFLRQLYGSHKQEIDKFEAEFSLDLLEHQSHKQVLEWSLRSKMFWESLQAMPKLTMSPKVLTYLRLPFRELYEAIRGNYKPEIGEAFVVLPLTKMEAKKLQANINNYLIFPSFMKAYSNEKAAMAEFKKKPENYLIRIILPDLHQKNSMKALDFGFYRARQSGSGPNIIFNIYNFFLINELEGQEIILTYGSLAEVAYRRNNRRESQQFNSFEENLMRNFDYWEDITSKIDSQASVLQLYGYNEESLHAWNKKYEIVRRSQSSEEALHKILIELGDAHKVNEQYQLAQRQYLSIGEGSKCYFKALVHLAELYIKTGQKKLMEETVKKIEANLSEYQEDNKVESFRGRNCMGMKLMEQGEYKAAGRLYKDLGREVNAHYDLKSESIPLVHEIYRNRATCETKLNNFEEALNLLDSTIRWQKACEGTKSPGLLKTEQLITSVRESQGHLKQGGTQQNDWTVKRKKNVSDAVNPLPMNLNQSTVHIELSTPQESQSHKDGPKRLIDQSEYMKIDDL